jgi:hypothetical protein
MDGRAVDLDHRLDYELTNEIWFHRSSNRCVRFEQCGRNANPSNARPHLELSCSPTG